MPNHEPKTECRTPNPNRPGTTRIPTWKFELLRTHIIDIVSEARDQGAPFKDLTDLVAARIEVSEQARLGSIGWHTTTVKLELEVAGEIKRLEGVSPQRLILGS